MLTLDQTAPPLTVQDTAGARVSLTSLAGPAGLLVYLMRTTTCPVCNVHVRSLARDRAHFADFGIALAVAVPEDAATAAAWRAKRGLDLPVVVGVGTSVHEWAGFTRKAMLQQSGTVLLDSGGVVRHVHAATMPPAALDRRAVDAAIGRLAARA